MSVVILGGGLAGFSVANYLDEESIILEKEEQLGGLCRSFSLNGIKYDIGPHIIFSKNKEALEKLIELVPTNQIKRSNKIYIKGRLVKYPLENDLFALSEMDRSYCLKEFLNNPYEDYEAENMLQFFLKTFGEGITRLYLQPYNEKIWKYDPVYMDTQMVERIPKPPKEDIIKSARGIETEGYTHQLYFHYPKQAGIQSIVESYYRKIAEKSKIINPVKIHKICKPNNKWRIETNKGLFTGDKLINCMPIHELFKYYEAPPEIMKILNNLKYNSIYIIVLQLIKDALGNNFAFNIADKDIIFHRLTKLNFLGENYALNDNGSTIMAEVTYRPGSHLSELNKEDIVKKTVSDIDKLGFINKKDITAIDIKNFHYAYVIYDLHHRKNMDHLLNFLSNADIYSCGRFAEFEYLNMDKIIEHSYNLAEKLNGGQNA